MSNFHIKKKQLPKHTKEFEIAVKWDLVSQKREEAFSELSSQITVPGFRKGVAPKDLVAKYISPESLYDRTGRKVLPELYRELVDKEKIQPVTTPDVELIEAKENEDWKFKVTVAEIPTVKVENYKEKVKAAHEKAKAEKAISSKGEKKIDAVEEKVIDKKIIAPVGEIFKVLLAEAEVEIPDLLTKEEVTRRVNQLHNDLKKVGMTMEHYLTSRELTAEKLQEQFVKDAEDMYKIEFIIAEIAREQGFKVEESELGAIFASAKTDKERSIAAQNMEWYEGILRKQKVIDFLNDL